MDLLVEVSKLRVLCAFTALLRQKSLQEAQRAGWPLPREIAVHLLLLELGLRPH
jgi:hypothetical protein